MNYVAEIKNELGEYIDQEKAALLPRFFKTGPGEYAEGDRFIGVTVPNQRKVAKKYFKVIPMDQIGQLLREPIHEYRQTALFIMVYKYKKLTDEADKKDMVELYLNNTAFINNWDLVDSSAAYILGPYYIDKNKELLYEFVRSNDLWKQRIAVLTTFYFIKQGQYDDTRKIAELLLKHPHDLIHKAVGWMLREIGNRDFAAELNFLKAHYQQMPRTMLRYAIEKFDEELRQKFLKGQI